MADDLTLLGAMVALRCITLDDAEQVVAFCRYTDDVDFAPADIAAAIDRALDFFNEDPNVEAAQEAARREAPHGTCSECGGALTEEDDDIITDVDLEMSLDLWVMVLDMVRTRDGAVPPAEGDE